MTKEKLEKCNTIAKEIEKCQSNIKITNLILSDNFKARQSYLRIPGVDNSIELPEDVLRVVGKLILSEYNQKLSNLEKEFESI